MLKEPYSGMIRYAHLNLLQITFIRTQDVRATEIDKVEIYKCFRPGDIVKAEVISLGDSRSYILSTAKNEYGVIYATSVAGISSHNIIFSLRDHKIKFHRLIKHTYLDGTVGDQSGCSLSGVFASLHFEGWSLVWVPRSGYTSIAIFSILGSCPVANPSFN